jgi:glycosyltransferase involved in cell wall biosynthesis
MPRVALVHDFLLDLRGAERVFAVLCDMYPDADVYTAVYDPRGTDGWFEDRHPRATFLQRTRPTARTFRALLPLYPIAMESLDLSGYDLVISSSSAWAHGVIADEDALHVCYCHNPFRYAWNAREETLRRQNPVLRAMLAAVFQRWRQWDWIAAQRVDRYLANSHTTANRVRRYLSREAEVVYPPVDVERFASAPVGHEYVVLSELMPHKRIDVAIRAFNALRRPLVVAGNGPELRRLRRLAGPTIRFEGRVSDGRAAELLARAPALVVTATEEFGIAAVEAQAAGRPVIALHEGGARETVVEGETGTFYAESDPDALAETVAGFDALAVDPAACRANAERFDVAHFSRAIRAAIGDASRQEPRLRPERRRVTRRRRSPAPATWH